MVTHVRRALIGVTLVLGGCWFVPPEDTAHAPARPQPALRSVVVQPLAEVHVQSVGAISVESDYLPRVVCCENGSAPSEALKAQAVMARTYVHFRYYDEKLGTSDRPLSGTAADQAYFCNNELTAACRAAVRVTEGQLMTFPASAEEAVETGPDTLVNVGFFVDGPRPACVTKHTCACPRPDATVAMTVAAHPTPCECFDFGSQGRASPKYVTFNWSLAGRAVQSSVLGNPLHGSNRGCASQNIENCLAYAGWRYHDILRFFYGQDVELRTARGDLLPPEAEDASRLGTPADDPPSSGCGASRIARRARKGRTAYVAVPVVGLAAVGVALLVRRRRHARDRARARAERRPPR